MSKTVQQIVEEYLEANGYDGLYDSDNECACAKENLFPCLENPVFCKPGYKTPCDAEDDCGCSDSHDYHIGPDKATEGAE